jgi:hypothetical protein
MKLMEREARYNALLVPDPPLRHRCHCRIIKVLLPGKRDRTFDFLFIGNKFIKTDGMQRDSYRLFFGVVHVLDFPQERRPLRLPNRMWMRHYFNEISG